MEYKTTSASAGVQERPAPDAKPNQAGHKDTEATLRSSPVRTLLLIAAILIVGLLLAISYTRWASARKWPEGLIQVNGRMEGDRVTISSKFAGRIDRLLAREGDSVTRGQVLVKLDDPQTRAQIDQAQANLRMAAAQAQGTQTNVSLTSATTGAQILQAAGLVSQAESGISGAANDLERAEAAVTNATAMVRSAEATVLSAEAALEAAQASRARAEAGVLSAQAQVVTAQANARAAHSAVDSAQVAFERADHDADRMSRLFAEQAISEQAMDQATLAAKAAKAEVETVRQQAAAADALVTARQAEVDSERRQVTGAEAAVKQARAQAKAAEQQVAAANANKEQTQAQTRVARQTVLQARAKRQQALADLKKARTAPEQIDISRASHSQSKAHIEQSRAAVHELQSVLKDLSLISPVSATVTTRMRDVGEVVSAGTPILDLVDLDRIYLKAYVPENQIGRLRLGLPARIYVDAFPNSFFEATVGYIASAAEFTPKEVQTPEERVKQVYAVKLYVKRNPEHRLTPGMVADAVIQWKADEKWQKPRW